MQLKTAVLGDDYLSLDSSQQDIKLWLRLPSFTGTTPTT